MEKQFKQLLELFTAWRDWSMSVNGWGTTYYLNSNIRCYFAKGDKFTAVKIENIDISYHDNPRIEIEDMLNCTSESLSVLIEKYTVELEVLKSKHIALTEAEIQEKKKQEIESLKLRLQELEN